VRGGESYYPLLMTDRRYLAATILVTALVCGTMIYIAFFYPAF
jgi:hypothetical protein